MFISFNKKLCKSSKEVKDSIKVKVSWVKVRFNKFKNSFEIIPNKFVVGRAGGWIDSDHKSSNFHILDTFFTSESNISLCQNFSRQDRENIFIHEFEKSFKLNSTEGCTGQIKIFK